VQAPVVAAAALVSPATTTKSSQPSIRLIPFLPSDAASASSSAAAAPAVAAAAAALRAALSLSDADFWAWASSESGAEVALCLDSYLQFARRPHDGAGDGDGNGRCAEAKGEESRGGPPPREGEQPAAALHRAVLLLLLRLAEGDFPPNPSPSTTPSLPLETAAGLLTLPRILDACALYLPSTPHLARRLARRAWRRCHATLPPALDGALPAVAADLDGVREALEGRLAARRRRKGRTTRGGEGGGPSLSSSAAAAARSKKGGEEEGEEEGEGEEGEAGEVLAGLRLWRDSCFSLAALAASHRGAAGAMLESCGGGLVASLAGAHDELLPAVEAAFSRRGAAAATCSPSSESTTAAAEKVRDNIFPFQSFFGIQPSQTPHSIIRATGPRFLPQKDKKRQMAMSGLFRRARAETRG